MKHVKSILLLGLMAFAFSSCTASSYELPEEEPTPTAVPPSPSPTIVWFPPSATPTPQKLPTVQPTQVQNPGIGSILLQDDFSSGEPWNPAVSEDASIDVSHGRLTIAVQPGVTASRVRQGSTFTDFYAELTARPSLCRDADEYGMLFRAANNVAFYAYVATCNGSSRVERLRFDRAYPLHDPVPSSDVPPGAPGEVRLGVWVSGSEMRFFLNGRYQFSIDDRSYALGSVGAFARSAGETPVTITFSDLEVRKVNSSPVSATPTP